MNTRPDYDHISPEARVAPENRIYVNRNLRMSGIRAIGFDLDHTLAHYRGPAVEELAFRLSRRRLVERFGYPESLLEVPYEREFVIRGLVVDKRRGNILKMDYHNYVARGYHGRRRLDPAARKASYRTGRVRMAGGSYVSVDTLFHLPEVYLYAVLVDMADEGNAGRRPNYRKIYEHVREAIDSVHGDGTLKEEILANIPKFVRSDPRLGATLRELRGSGKKLFLLTNSEFYYSDALLSHLLEREEGDPRWMTLFDAVVVDAGKPAYFTNLDRAELEHEEVLPEGAPPVRHAGNARLLERHLGFAGDQILYFGDHTYGDILRSKKTLGWRTAMVVEELERELAVTRRLREPLEALTHRVSMRMGLEADLSDLERRELRLRRRIEEHEEEGKPTSRDRGRLEQVRTAIAAREADLQTAREETSRMGTEVNREYNVYWGPLFREGRETSRFGHQVRDFACIYMTRVSNLLNYHPNHYFQSASDRMPHEIPL